MLAAAVDDAVPDAPANWTELSAEELAGPGYPGATRGWRNDETRAEVVVFRTEPAGTRLLNDQPWVVRHPPGDDGTTTTTFGSESSAETFALDYLTDHPEPEGADPGR